jgi:hypothetical protein
MEYVLHIGESPLIYVDVHDRSPGLSFPDGSSGLMERLTSPPLYPPSSHRFCLRPPLHRFSFGSVGSVGVPLRDRIDRDVLWGASASETKPILPAAS